MTKTVYLIRSCSGSGKSALAKKFAKYAKETLKKTCVILSTDDIFSTTEYLEGKNLYYWGAQFLGLAHKLNLYKFEGALKDGIDVIVVDNTMTTYKEVKPYMELADKYNYNLSLKTPHTPWANDAKECFNKNTHNVPLEVIEKQIARFESNSQIMDKWIEEQIKESK